MDHSFNVDVATKYGIEEAIVLQNLAFWVQKNSANKRHWHDGHYWTYNSAAAFADLFPYLNQKKVYRILSNLENHGLILTGNYNDSKYNRTKWYTITEDAIGIIGITIYHNSEMENQEAGNQVDDIGDCITDSKPDINPDSKPYVYQTSQPSPKESKKTYGEFENVTLTDKEYAKLIHEYGHDQTNGIIERLSIAKAEKGYKYKSDMAAIRKWVVKATGAVIVERPKICPYCGGEIGMSGICRNRDCPQYAGGTDEGFNAIRETLARVRPTGQPTT
jgi:hypothetical protein